MGKISEKSRLMLKKPLGKLFKSVRELKLSKAKHRIISIGDMITLELLDAGIRPHLAVFDFKCMRKRLGKKSMSILRKAFPHPEKYRNPAGTVSDQLISDASFLIKKGGALQIIGEEDLTALAFIRKAGKRDIILYGQPDKGMVLVKANKKILKKIDRFLFKE